MRLYRLPKNGTIDSLEIVEADVPKPERGQVLVRMRAASLNYRDLMVASGRYALGDVPEDLIPVSDGAGEVVEVGEDVTRVTSGDRVSPNFLQTWIGGDLEEHHNHAALGGSVHGVLAEYRLFDQESLVHVPPHLSFEQAATLPCAALTAWNALFTSRAAGPGQTVLILGTGGVSVFALQFAKLAGARVIGTSSSDEKLERVGALGLDEAVNYRTTPEWQRQALELTGGRGVDHVVEVGGPGTLPRSIEAARVGGWIHLIGSGLAPGDSVSPAPAMRKGLVLRGIRIGSREMFEAMNRAVAFHRLEPVIDRTFPFEEAKAAYRHLESQSHIGKVVVSID